MPNADLTETGTAGNDALRGADGNDSLYGLGGNDTVRPGFGNDLALGGAGDDRFVHVGGDDTLDGGAGGDTLVYDGPQRVKLDLNRQTGQALGTDLLTLHSIEHVEFSGTDGNVIIGTCRDGLIRATGVDTDDRQFGLGGHDTLIGGGGDDTLMGGAGDDLLTKTGGSGRLFGGLGDDTLQAGGGDSLLVGGSGADRLVTGAGRDLLWGGSPASGGDAAPDVFVFDMAQLGRGAARDVIRDFETGLDRLAVDGGVFIGAAGFTGTAGEIRAVVVNTNTLVQVDSDGDGFADGDILLNGAPLLSADDFLL